MALATKCLHKQQRFYFSYIWRGLALIAIGIFSGIMILKNGIGNAPTNEYSTGNVLYKLLTRVMGQNITSEMLVPICFAGFFFIIAAIGLFNVVRGAWQIIPTRTMLGKSVLAQAKSYERFSDVIDSINTDMEQEPYNFGAVFIGREWLLEAEAMRLSTIRGVFCVDAGKEDYVLCCVDETQNIWACGLTIKADRDGAAEYLQRTLPYLAATGGKDAYFAFLGQNGDI